MHKLHSSAYVDAAIFICFVAAVLMLLLKILHCGAVRDAVLVSGSTDTGGIISCIICSSCSGLAHC